MNMDTKDYSSLSVPTIHLNGSSGGRLADALQEAMRGCHNAIELLAATEPHGRDYYPQGEGAYEKARDEYLARRRAIENVCKELAYIEERIHEARHR